MLYGWLKEESEDNLIEHLVREERIALPLYAQFGTEPNVYYIPPTWVPHKFLAQMFGNYEVEVVNSAIQKYAKPSKKTSAILRLFGVTNKIIENFKVDEKTVEAYDEGGNQIVAVPM
jgi:nitrate reductase beta subunit